jgi:hypothetical protein
MSNSEENANFNATGTTADEMKEVHQLFDEVHAPSTLQTYSREWSARNCFCGYRNVQALPLPSPPRDAALRAKDIDLENTAQIGGHSLQCGHATEAALSGVLLNRLRRQLGHQGSTTTAGRAQETVADCAGGLTV